MPRNLPWTPEEDRQLKMRHGNGTPARQIAEELASMGFPARSRCAVIGRLQRLGMSIATKRKTGAGNYRSEVKGIPSVAGSHRHCQWPLWEAKPDGRYCGGQVIAGRPYCAEHAARAYQPKSKVDDRNVA